VSDVDDADEVESQSRHELIEGHCGRGKDIKTHINIDRRVQDPCRGRIGVHDIYLIYMLLSWNIGPKDVCFFKFC